MAFPPSTSSTTYALESETKKGRGRGCAGMTLIYTGPIRENKRGKRRDGQPVVVQAENGRAWNVCGCREE